MSARDVTNHYRMEVQKENAEFIEKRYKAFQGLIEESDTNKIGEYATVAYVNACSRHADREEMALHIEAIEDHLLRIKELLT